MRISKLPLLACLFASLTSLALAADENDEAVAQERAVRKYLEVKFDNFVETPEGRKVFGPAYNSKNGLKPIVVKELQEFLPDTSYYAFSLDTPFGPALGGNPLIIAVTKRDDSYDVRTCAWPVRGQCTLLGGKFLYLFSTIEIKTDAKRKQFALGIGQLIGSLSQLPEVKCFAAAGDSVGVELWDAEAPWLQVKVKFDGQGRSQVSIEPPVRDRGASDAAVSKLLAFKADVEWVTTWGFLAGNSMPLPEAEHHYCVTIDEAWTGGNEGLALLNDVARLKSLRIEDNRDITDDGLARIGKLAEVEEFFLRRIRVSKQGLAVLSRMPRLKQLVLQGLPVTDDDLTGLAQLTTIEALDLVSMKDVGDKTIKVLEPLPRLKALTLARAGISDAGLQHLNPRVESLNLFETQITDAGLKWLQPLVKLKYLSLIRTRITDQGVPALARLPALETVNFGGTAVTTEGIKSLRQERGPKRPISIEGEPK